MNFDDKKFYIRTANFGKETPVQGSILNRRNETNNTNWLEVIGQDAYSLVVIHKNLPDSMVIDKECDAAWIIKFEINKLRKQTKPVKKARRSRSGKPNKKVNYAELVVKR